MADYRFRPATEADLPMLATWLASPQVAAWWPDAEAQLAGIAEDMNDPAMTQLIVTADGQPIAHAQHYPAHHWQAPLMAGLPSDAIAFDVFAAPQALGQGGAWLSALADHLLTLAPVIAVDPDPENTRAIRAYEKAGFRGNHLGQNEKGETLRLMTRRR